MLNVGIMLEELEIRKKKTQGIGIKTKKLITSTGDKV